MSAALAAREGAAHARAAHQFVTFWIAGEVFALPLDEVQEIIRMPGIVRVPMADDSLIGIANLRGAVLPITSLRRIFDMNDIAYDDATRVVVGNHGGLSGFVVDRMASVITTDPDEIEPIGNIAGTVRTDLLAGIVKRDDSTIMLLDPPRLRSEAAPAIDAPAAGASAPEGFGSHLQPDQQRATTRGNDRGGVVQLVSFEVDDQEYAFPIEDVQEIVQVPPRIRSVPRSAPHVLGVMTLRNRLLPLVSLRRMFGMTPAPLDEHNRIVVVTLKSDAGPADRHGGPTQVSVGIVMDSVNEVLRVARSLVEPVPSLLMSAADNSELQAICRLDGGRLVTILSAAKMFPEEIRARCVEACAADQLPDQTAFDKEPAMETALLVAANVEPDEEQFVVFRLSDEEFGVPIDAVQEIVRVPEHLTRVPRTPAFIEGVVNLRGVVLPVVEQRRRFGLPELARTDRQRIIVLMVGEVRTGFIVDSVVEVLKVACSTIGPAPLLSQARQRLVDRVANLEQQKRMLLLIRPAKLLSLEEQGAVAEL